MDASASKRAKRSRGRTTPKMRREKTMVSASELSQMGVCERLVLFEARYGKRTSSAQDRAIERGRAEHARFFGNGVRSQFDLQTSLPKPWCFCASLAWGPRAPETDLLRQFRDRILRRTAAGRIMIRMYYSNAPDLCRRLHGHSRLISAIRLGLTPALWIARAALAIQGTKEKS